MVEFREAGAELTAREIEVLALVAEGCGNEEIGRRLLLSPHTIKAHVRRILVALDARTRAHAVTIGFRRGLVE